MKKMNRNEWIAVGVGLVFVGFLLYGGSFSNMFGGDQNIDQLNQQTIMINENTANQDLPESGVEAVDINKGTGATAEAGDEVTVHYVGVLTNGQEFDSSLKRGEPFTFTLGAGQVIRGWDEGVAGMQVGGVRRLLIAPDYGYGDIANGPIPASSTLVFEVQLLDVEKATQ